MLLRVIKHIFKMIKSAKISVKMTFIYACMFSLVLLILNVSVLYGVRYYLYNQASKQVDDIGAIMLDKISSHKYNSLTDKDIFSDVPSRANIYINILKEDGSILNMSNTNDYTIDIMNSSNSIKKVEKNDKHFLYKTIEIDTPQYGTLYIQVVKEMINEYYFMKILFVFMAVADLIGVIVSIILGYIISQRMLRPIDIITKAASNISINNLKERIDVSGPDDELKNLGITFNKMIDRLQDAINRQIQFASDASHELRTPISVIQGHVNLLNRWGKDDRQALEKSINAIKLEANEMADLIEKLLFIAKGETGKQILDKEVFCLNQLINDIIAAYQLIENSHIIEAINNDIVYIFADYKMIKQMLRIFIDNSIKFTPQNGKIVISTENEKNYIRITVSDNGIGITRDDINKIFERFYTVDKSRSKQSGGTGLGLSIAKWIVDAHEGRVQVKSTEGEGTDIIVWLQKEVNIFL